MIKDIMSLHAKTMSYETDSQKRRAMDEEYEELLRSERELIESHGGMTGRISINVIIKALEDIDIDTISDLDLFDVIVYCMEYLEYYDIDSYGRWDERIKITNYEEFKKTNKIINYAKRLVNVVLSYMKANRCFRKEYFHSPPSVTQEPKVAKKHSFRRGISTQIKAIF